MNNYIRLSVFLFILLLALGGCNIKFEEEILIPSPTVDATAAGNIVGIKKYSSDISFINIYREDVTGGASNPAESIGAIYTQNYEGGDVYLFIDSLILKDHTYRYYARIINDGVSENTYWSNEVKTIQTTYSDGGTPLPKPATPTNFAYDKSDHKLTYTISSTPALPTDYCLALVYEVEGKTQTIELPEFNNGGTDEVVSLSGLFSQSYNDKPIKIIGICGQKIEKNSSKNKWRIYWTLTTPVTVTGTTKNTFIINSSGGGTPEDR